jgi:hypothetical protein
MIKDVDYVLPFRIDPAKILPCLSDSCISTRFFARDVFSAQMIEAVRTSETSFSSTRLYGDVSKKAVIFSVTC